MATPVRQRRRETRPQAPDMASPVWVRAIELGLPQAEVDAYESGFMAQAGQKKRHGLLTGLGLTPEAWQVLAYEFTDIQMGRAVGLLSAAVTTFRKRRGITNLTQRQRREQAEGRSGPSLDDLTKVRLEMLLESMPLKEIAALYGVANPAIRKRCQEWGVYVPSKSERALSDKILTEDQKQAVWGMMLGDGLLSDAGFFKVTHGYEQHEYLLHCRQLLLSVARPVRYEESTKDNGTLCHQFSFRTDMHPWFKTQRSLWYPEGARTKTCPPDVIDRLTPLALAVWFMDDGHRGTMASFALGDIPLEIAEEVARRTAARFEIETYLQPHSRTGSCKIMGVRGSSLDRFFSLIKEHVPNNLLHKLPPAHWKAGTRPEGRVNETDSELFPNDLVARSKEWGSLEADEQDQVVAEVMAYWRRVGFPFHEARVRDLRTLVNVESRQILKKDALKAWQVGQSSCISFHPHYWRTPVYGREGQTPLERFERDGDLRKTVLRVLKGGYVPNAPRLRSVLAGGHNSMSNFRPSVAKILIERFCPRGGVVWDPCAGWGGRLLGAATASCEPRYVACEPQTETHGGLLAMVEWLAGYLPGVQERIELHGEPAEDFDPPSGLDLVLTSPPYFKKELYGRDETQSWVRYPTYREWLEGFLAPVMVKARDRLRPGGWLVLNVADVTIDGTRHGIVADAKHIASELGLGEPEVLRYELPTLLGDKRDEPVLCWSKSREAVRYAGGAALQLVMCGQCGRVTDHRVLREGICPACDLKVVRCQYPGCGKDLPGAVASKKYCDDCSKKVDAERARGRRREAREVVPAKTVRVFTCACGAEFEVPVGGGRPRECPDCARVSDARKVEEEARRRTKTCAYRHCGREFVDTSKMNGAKFCHEEHRRREKQFRDGEASSVADFRYADPVLDEGPTAVMRTCQKCGDGFEQLGGRQKRRCPACEAEARAKVCATEGCPNEFRDESERNNRRYCDGCQAANSGRTGKTAVLRRRLDPEKLKVLAAADVPVRKMAEVLGVPASTVDRHLKKHGIEHARIKGNPKHRGA